MSAALCFKIFSEAREGHSAPQGKSDVTEKEHAPGTGLSQRQTGTGVYLVPVPCSSGCCHADSQIFKHNGRNTIYGWPSHPQLTFPLRKYCFLHFLSKKLLVYKFPSPSLLREEPQLRCLEGACPGKGPKLPARFWSWQYWLESADYEISRTSVGWFLTLPLTMTMMGAFIPWKLVN